MPDEVKQDNEFEVTTTVQVERTYKVKAKDSDAAHERLRRYLKDPEMAAPGIVEQTGTQDTGSERVKTETIREISKPRAVDGADKAGSKTTAAAG